MAAETTIPRVPFTIDDVEYEYPDFADLTLDEWTLVYDICGVTIQDFAVEEDAKLERARLKKLEHPAVFKAFACVGYMRAHPDADVEDAQTIVGKVKMIPFLTSMAGEEEEEDPTSAQTPDESSDRSRDDSNGSSSPASPPSSETQEDPLATTGISG